MFAHSFSTSLSEEELHVDPMEQFRQWFEEISTFEHLDHPEAMIVATASAEGRPSARTVLMKQFDERGIVFFTNYTSAKGQALEANPYAEAVFYWEPLARQVRISGPVEKLSREESNAYYQSRAHGSRIGAWASPQSQKISSREELEARIAEVEARFEGQDPPCPDFWGGFRILATEIEFWQGRDFRVHDRFVYQKEAGQWKPARLAP
jgi:pyridoxamine 5'-phosphate oxidase